MPSTIRPTSPETSAIWLCVAATVFGFFLPWARLDFNMGEVEKQFSKSAKRALGRSFGTTRKAPRHAAKGTQMIPTVVRGYQIPIMANRKNAKVAMQLVKMFTKKDEAIGLKSYAVYLIPGLAVFCGWLLAGVSRQRAARAAVAVLCAAVAAGGCWTLLTTDTRKDYAIVIGEGIWLSLAAYAGLTAIAVRWLASPRRAS